MKKIKLSIYNQNGQITRTEIFKGDISFICSKTLIKVLMLDTKDEKTFILSSDESGYSINNWEVK